MSGWRRDGSEDKPPEYVCRPLSILPYCARHSSAGAGTDGIFSGASARTRYGASLPFGKTQVGAYAVPNNRDCAISGAVFPKNEHQKSVGARDKSGCILRVTVVNQWQHRDPRGSPRGGIPPREIPPPIG